MQYVKQSDPISVRLTLARPIGYEAKFTGKGVCTPSASMTDVAAQSSSKSPLTGLPVELLALILSHLSKPELKDVRLTCKVLSDNSIPILFSTVVASIFPTDLEIFTKISKLPHLSSSVRTLFYNILQYNPKDERTTLCS